MKKDIKGLGLKELEKILEGWGRPRFAAGQIFSWIYKKGASCFGEMTNLALDLREKLEENFYLFGLRMTKSLKSADGTEKFLFELKDANLIEAVVIPSEKRLTACLSTQAGCKYTCSFCASGIKGFRRNLTSGEIIEQALYLKNNSTDKKLSHIVFMGTGEPLDNYDHLLKAVRLINASGGLNIAARRVTISTCGVIPGIKRLAGEGLQIELSVSLHAPDDKTRLKILPINKVYPLKDLISACRQYILKTNRQVTFEYVLIRGLNSSLQSSVKLGRILKGLNAKVNLIPCNKIEGLKPEPPQKKEILLFRDSLLNSGINVTLRKRRGEDIEAACGQLRLRHEKE